MRKGLRRRNFVEKVADRPPKKGDGGGEKGTASGKLFYSTLFAYILPSEIFFNKEYQ